MMLYINGRFLTQPVSGVQRYARELLGALDQLLSDGCGSFGPVEVLVPHAVEAPDWKVLRVRVVRGGAGHVWEQGALARAARGGILVSLGNAGPLLHSNHVLCLHDAHLFDIPQAFSRRYRLWHRALRPALARRARALITVSAHSAQALGQHLGIAATRFNIVPNSAQHVHDWASATDAPLRYGLDAGGYLLSVGTQSPNKNLAALIAAHAQAGPDVLPLALVGATVPGLAKAATGQGRVHQLGRVPDNDLRGLYEGAAGFVFPSLHEGFGIPPLEAMELGVPVICARSGAMPDVLGDAPLWFDPRDSVDMTRALQDFAQMSEGDSQKMIERGHRVASGYRWRDSALQLQKVLTGAVEHLQNAPARDILAMSTHRT